MLQQEAKNGIQEILLNDKAFPAMLREIPHPPEKLWVCIRLGERRGVTEEECERCPFWEALPEPAKLN